jgi:hypothetical protein
MGRIHAVAQTAPQAEAGNQIHQGPCPHDALPGRPRRHRQVPQLQSTAR